MTFTDDLLEEWETFGRAAGWSEGTVEGRLKLLRVLSNAVAPTALEDTSPNELARFIAKFDNANTRSTYWRHARSFFAWLKMAGYRADDPTETVRRPKRPYGVPRPCSDEVIAALLGTDACNPRVRAWVLLGAYAGLRIHEIAKVRGEDFDLHSGTLRVLGKGGVEAVLPLHPLLVELAETFPRTGWWFPTYDARHHINPATVGMGVKRAAARLGHSVTAHQLRHWYGTNILRSSGGNLRVAQECLRHASPATTAIYTQLVSTAREEAIGALPTL